MTPAGFVQEPLPRPRIPDDADPDGERCQWCPQPAADWAEFDTPAGWFRVWACQEHLDAPPLLSLQAAVDLALAWPAAEPGRAT